jgi:serine/threonine protein kinase
MLSDFGVAKILEADETMDLTGTSMGVGTPEYMAPEQVTSKTADARADIYSLGVVFFELVTGRKPFMADTPMAVLFKQASEPLPRPRQFLPGLPEMVEKVLFKALAKRPEDRYQVAEAFAKELERLERSEMKGSWGDLEKEASKPRRMIWLMGGLIGLVVLAAGIGLGTLFRKPTVRTAPITKITSTSVLTTVNPFISSSTTAKQEIYANTESATVTIAASPTITPTLNSISILTPPPTLSPSDYGTLQYEDNFDLDTGTWSLDKGSTIQNGMLILEAGTSTSPFWNNNYSFSNFIFETSFKYINPVQTGYTGMSVYLRFSLNCNNGSTGNCDDQVGVSSNGVVLAWRQVSPNSTLQILSESSAAAFNPSGFNKLTIFVNGSEFRIFINDVFVRSFIDSTYKSGIIVMDETGSSAVAFDYVRIYALP